MVVELKASTWLQAYVSIVLDAKVIAALQLDVTPGIVANALMMAPKLKPKTLQIRCSPCSQAAFSHAGSGSYCKQDAVGLRLALRVTSAWLQGREQQQCGGPPAPR